MTTTQLLDLTEARAVLGGIGRTKLYELVGTGELRTVKIGRRRFVPVQAIEEYVQGLSGAEPVAS